MAAERYNVLASEHGLLRTEVATVSVSEKPGAAISLRFEPGALSVAGRVRGSDGKAVGGAKVTLTHRDAAGTAFATLADGDGRFVLRNLPPGAYYTRCEADGRADVRKGSIRIRSSVAGLNIILPRAGTIIGRVVFPPGKPRPRFLTVSTVDPSRGPSEPAEGGLTHTWGVVCGDGTYRLTNLSPGNYTLRLLAEGRVLHRVKAPVGEGKVSYVPIRWGASVSRRPRRP